MNFSLVTSFTVNRRHGVTYNATKKFIFVYSFMVKPARLKYANTIAIRYYNKKTNNFLIMKKYCELLQTAKFCITIKWRSDG